MDGLRALRPAVGDPEKVVGLPTDPILRFEDVRFRYPGREDDVLEG